jgi:hypothetical protein
MRRLILPAITLLLTACNPFQASSGTSSPSSGGSASASASSGPVTRALWILSPVGLRLRDQPSSTGNPVATIPQGTQVTATEFQDKDGGWYRVEYQGTKGWISAKDRSAHPPQDLVTTHPQLSYSNPAAGYYFLYPANWQVSDQGVNVEVRQAQNASPNPQGNPQPGAARMIVHQAQDVGQLGNVPTTAGGNLGDSDIEVGGITALRRTFQLTGGGLEGDVKVKYATDRAILITFRGAAQPDLDTWTEILESFGFSVPPRGAAASPSPSR